MISFKDLRKSSVYLTPNFPDISTKRYKLSTLSLLAMLLAYTIVVAVVVIGILIITPADKIAFIFENQELQEQALRLKEFENKVNFLTKELNYFSSSNKRLKFALILAQGDSVDTTLATYDSLKYEKEPNLKIGGSVYEAFLNLFQDNKQSSGIFFIKPVDGFVNNQYSTETGHMGIDFAVVNKTPVVAAASGYVISADYSANNGYTIILQHSDEFITIYKHCSALLKRERESVIQGETIALSGNSGYNTSGPHLHFEIWKKGKTLDPEKILLNLKQKD